MNSFVIKYIDDILVSQKKTKECTKQTLGMFMSKAIGYISFVEMEGNMDLDSSK